jgi:hypothetical protein
METMGYFLQSSEYRLAGRGAGGNDGTVEASLGDDVNLDGGVSTGIVDGAGEDLLDSHVD